MTLQQFKSAHGITAINLKQGSGRMFAKVPSATLKQDINLFCSKDCNLNAPLFVNLGAHDSYWIGNKDAAKDVATI